MTRPHRMPAARRRDQLLDAALTCFASAGYRDASMDAIADAAGVTKPVLYQHFSSKHALYRELLDAVGERMLHRIADRVAAATTPQARVRAGFEAYFEFVCESRASWQLLFASAARQGGDSTEAVERLEAKVAEVVGSLIDAAIDEEHRRLLGYSVVGIAEVTARRWVAATATPDPADAVVLARRLADLVWAGLRALPGAPALTEAASA